MMRRPVVDSPAYRVPFMSEIAAIPWNRFKVASTFSGCGGSSLGYKLAGFKVIWANEFVPDAQETYRANHPGTILNTSDIRQLTGAQLLSEIDMREGELDVLDGSPPCASFSTAGARQKNWGKEKVYSETKQRTDDLFWEYARLLREVKPKTFVAENVQGLVRGVATGFFNDILKLLREQGYCVKAQLVEAKWLGVPQRRVRVIFMGVRNDLAIEPVFPTPLPYLYSVRDAWGGERCEPIEPETSLEPHRVKGNGRFWFDLLPGQTHPKRFNAAKMPLDEPAFTLFATMGIPGAAQPWHPTEFRSLSLMEARRLSSFPDDFVFPGGYFKGMERIGRAVPPVMMQHIAESLRDNVLMKLGQEASVAA